MNETIGIIATVFAVIGVVLNNRRKSACFYLWLISNSLLAYIHWDARLYSLVLQNGIFLVLAIDGIVRWRSDKQ